ncbi:MAG: HD domain-containing protein, partial [Candidatus Methanomethylicaceae archaeon]
MIHEEIFYLTVLGALLHDIGKLGWRGAGGGGHTHEYYSREFVSGLPSPMLPSGKLLDIKKLGEIVYRHHDEDLEDLEPDLRTAIRIIQAADRRVSAIEREEVPTEEPEEPLESIFEKICICIDRRNHGGQEAHVYRPSPLQLDRDFIFPVKRGRLDKQEMRERSRELWRGLAGLRASLPRRIGRYIDTLYYMLKEYTSFTLSAGYKARPTAPLFDHLKTTAAVASSLYLYCMEKGVSPKDLKQEAFALVFGDVSG